jgi:hypothetical protein
LQKIESQAVAQEAADFSLLRAVGSADCGTAIRLLHQLGLAEMCAA